MKVKGRSRKRTREKRPLYGYLLSAAAMVALIGAFAIGVYRFSGKAGAREDEALRKAVVRATVQCYAIEGRYPPSVDYLEENYGIQIDRTKYNVFYDGFASNVMPQITIIPAEE